MADIHYVGVDQLFYRAANFYFATALEGQVTFATLKNY